METQNKLCPKCGGRIIWSSVPQEWINGFCPECAKGISYMVRDSKENQKDYEERLKKRN